MKNINFSFQTGVTRELLEGLSARRYDLVFASYPPAESKLVPVSQQDLVLIVPKGHPLAGAHVIDLADTLSKQKNNPCRSTRVVLLERVTRLELATSTLARWRSTG